MQQSPMCYLLDRILPPTKGKFSKKIHINNSIKPRFVLDIQLNIHTEDKLLSPS